MTRPFLLVSWLFFVGFCNCQLWPKGVVHYTINKKDYDVHSQDEIISTFTRIEKELCVKFFNTPLNHTTSDKILYISNPDKRKTCPPENYDYRGSVVDISIGYKCLNRKDIARIVVDMLRASIKHTVSTINSFDLVKKFQAKNIDPSQVSLLSPSDRNFINAHYANECAALSSRPGLVATYRRAGEEGGDLYSQDPLFMSDMNKEFYDSKLWPLGIVMYVIQEKIKGKAAHKLLKYAMTTIELDSCIVFQEISLNDTVLAPRNFLWFSDGGEEAPVLGFMEGNQTLDLESITHGAPGHTAHTLLNLMRALGVPMASNRPDRDNYVTVHWKYVLKGKEHYLERAPASSWLKQLPYDFDSVTHAPANYMCGDACLLGAQTVQPLQDHLWQRSLAMGHKPELSPTDIQYLKILYGKLCQNRFLPSV